VDAHGSLQHSFLGPGARDGDGSPSGRKPLGSPDLLTSTLATPIAGGDHWVTRHPTAIPWLYLGAITAAEVETAIFSIRVGLALHCLLLVLLPFHAVLARGRPYQPILLCLLVAPLIRIMSLTLPVIGFPIIDWYVLVSIPVIVSTFMIANVLGYRRSDLGLVWRRSWVQLAIILCGPLLGWIEGHILTVQGLAASHTVQSMLPAALILFVCSGFMEELVFRGLLQRAAFGLFADDGIFYISLLFAVLHTGYRSVEDSIFVFCVGLVFAIVVRRSGSIIGVTASHGLANTNLYVVLPLFFPTT
jgi:membrane protease YdiL (CAAX protease family)